MSALKASLEKRGAAAAAESEPAVSNKKVAAGGHGGKSRAPAEAPAHTHARRVARKK
jgi:hypothetical protein